MLVVFGCFGIIATGFMLGTVTGVIDSSLESSYHRMLGRRHGTRYMLRYKTLATIVLLLIYFPAVASWASHHTGWDIGSSLYFVFQTVSTIGGCLPVSSVAFP